MSLRRRCSLVMLAALGGACRDHDERPNGTRGGRAGTVTTHPSSVAARGANDGSSFVEHQIELRAAQFGASLVPAAPTARGSLVQGGAASHEFDVIANHCYRILAVGGVEVNDIDLALYGPDGSELDADTEGSDYPSLGTSRPICPPSPGRYRVEVRMRGGQGEYGVAILRTP